MRNASFAEWILSLVMPADRAASTAGDLLELPSARNPIRLWASVTRIFAASVWQSFTAHPGTIARVALIGFVTEFLAPLPLLLVVRLSIPMAGIWCWLALTQFFVGLWLARLSRGNAIAVCAAMGILNIGIGLLHVNNGSVNMAIWQIPLAAGMIVARGRSRQCAA